MGMWQSFEFHELAEEYPLMPEAELARLTQAMRERGFNPKFPVVIWKGQVLDGRNRYLAAQRAGVKPTFVTFQGTREEARRFVQDANEHRRHLAPEWLAARRQERLQRVAQARQGGESLRAIADAEGVSASQVVRDLGAVTVPGGTVLPEGGQVNGRDGRQQPAQRPSPSGQEVFDQRAFNDHLGACVRLLDRLARDHGLVDGKDRIRMTPAHEGLRRKIEEVIAEVKVWRTELSKEKRP